MDFNRPLSLQVNSKRFYSFKTRGKLFTLPVEPVQLHFIYVVFSKMNVFATETDSYIRLI